MLLPSTTDKENFLAHFCSQRDQSTGKQVELDEDEIDAIRRTFAALNLSVTEKDIEAMISRIVQVVDPDEYQPILIIMFVSSSSRSLLQRTRLLNLLTFAHLSLFSRAEVRAYYQVAQKASFSF